jgi:hypothetical protein
MTPPETDRTTPLPRDAWQGLWLGFALFLPYAVASLLRSLASPYVVQDDARQHVFWTYRFVDAALFPGDLIADYFQAVAPVGYSLLYEGAAAAGLDPLLFSKLLPVALGLVATYYCYRLAYALWPSVAGAVLATVFLNLMIWSADDVASGTPRAFVYPLLLAALYYLRAGRTLPLLAALALQGIFYPQSLLVSLGVVALQALRWDGRRPGLQRDRAVLLRAALGIAVGLAVLAPFALATSQYGPVVSRAVARTLPEFLQGGRSEFFSDNWLNIYLGGSHRGSLWPIGLKPGLGIALLVLAFGLRGNQRRSGASHGPDLRLLWEVLAVSLALYVLAHLLLFKLHLPSRYTSHTLRIVLAVVAGQSAALLVRWLRQAPTAGGWRDAARRLASIQGVALVAVLAYPLVKAGMGKLADDLRYRTGEAPGLYEALARTPLDARVATLSWQGNYVPALARRAVLAAREYAIPYHLGYFREFERRVRATIEAQYTDDPAVLAGFVATYGVSHFLVDGNAFEAGYLEPYGRNRWFTQYAEESRVARDSIVAGRRPLLAVLAPACAVWQDARLSLVSARCLVERLQGTEARVGPG